MGVIIQVIVWMSLQSGKLSGSSVKQSLTVSVINSSIDIFAACLGFCFSGFVKDKKSYDQIEVKQCQRTNLLSDYDAKSSEAGEQTASVYESAYKNEEVEFEYRRRIRTVSVVDEDYNCQ